MTDPEMSFDDMVVADLRAHEGQVTSGPLTGHPLVIMTSTGAKSGQPRRAVLTYHRDGDDLVVAGTSGGAPTDPSWLHNLAADPVVDLEVDGRRVPATASIVADGPERDRLWTDHVAALPWFADYPNQVGGRVIPMVRLTLAS
jgi:deazaflavin-dependent oxidoreductase (nitroreductase family)